jgi:hypothetical protein
MNYFFTLEVCENEEDLIETPVWMRESIENGESYVERIENGDIPKIFAEYVYKGAVLDEEEYHYVNLDEL